MPGRDPSTAEELGRSIKRLQWRHQRSMDSGMRRLGMTLVQWDILRAVSRDPGAPARRLAMQTFQSEQAFGMVATGMERRGLITRTSGTGRIREHRLTEEGRLLYEEGRRVMASVVAETVGSLSASDRLRLAELLRAAGAQGAD